MNWDSETGKALRISLIIHGAIILLVVGWTVGSMIFNKPVIPPHVFELQGLKGPQHIGAPGRMAGSREGSRDAKPSSAESGGASSKIDLPSLKKPSVEPTQEVADDSAPAAKAPTKNTSKTKPVAAKPKATAKSSNTAVKAKPVSNTSSKPQLIGYDQFAKQNKLPPKTQKAGGAKAGSSAATGTGKGKGKANGKGPGIDVAGVVGDMRNNLSWGDGGDGGGGYAGGTGLTTGEQDALASYFDRIRAIIDSNFNEPKNVMQQVRAMVEFTISANGSVSGISIVNSSGNDTFDNASLAAVRALGRVDPPPGNMAYTRRIEFVGKRGQ